MVERIAYGGWDECYRLSNGIVEVVATAQVGPRLIRFGFVDGANEFAEFADQLGKRGGDEWRIYGGHRLWHAPEHPERTYYPDNEPIKVRVVDEWTLELTQPTEKTTGIQKRLRVSLSPDAAQVTVTHILINRNLWVIELAAWALSVMAPGGVAILPQPPFIPHGEKLLPARPLVQWHYTDMTDPRWKFGRKFILLRQDPNAPRAAEVGTCQLSRLVRLRQRRPIVRQNLPPHRRCALSRLRLFHRGVHQRRHAGIGNPQPLDEVATRRGVGARGTVASLSGRDGQRGRRAIGANPCRHLVAMWRPFAIWLNPISGRSIGSGDRA
jgi:hypothetical protein